MENTKYISAEKLSARLGLPKVYILELAQQQKIPSLDVKGRLRFNFETVQNALSKLSEGGKV